MTKQSLGIEISNLKTVLSQKISSLKLTDLVVLVIGLFLLAYSAYRAYSLSFTHDESFTFEYYVRASFSDIINLNPPNANDHILNTLLMKVFSSIFGQHQFVLRLHSIFAHIVYLIFSYLFLKRFKNDFLVITGFILLNFNPYFLEFFSLARGYALSHALMMASIYYLSLFAEKNDRGKLYWLSLVLAGFASYSNFVLLYFYVSVVVVYNLIIGSEYLNQKSIKAIFLSLVRSNYSSGIISLFFLVLFYEPIRRLIKFKQLYFGGNDTFWHDTVLSLSQGSLYGKFYFQYQRDVVAYIILGIVLVSAISIFLKFAFRRKNDISKLLFAAGILSIVISSFFLNRLLFKSENLVFRTSLFYYPLIMIVFICLMDYLRPLFKGIPVVFLSVVLSGGLLCHFVNVANVSYATEWIYDAHTREMLNDIDKDNAGARPNKKIKLAIHWTFEPTINFYRITKKYEWLEEVNHDGFELKADYYYIYREDSAYLYKTGKKILKRYAISNTILAKDTARYVDN